MTEEQVFGKYYVNALKIPSSFLESVEKGRECLDTGLEYYKTQVPVGASASKTVLFAINEVEPGSSLEKTLGLGISLEKIIEVCNRLYNSYDVADTSISFLAYRRGQLQPAPGNRNHYDLGKFRIVNFSGRNHHFYSPEAIENIVEVPSCQISAEEFGALWDKTKNIAPDSPNWAIIIPEDPFNFLGFSKPTEIRLLSSGVLEIDPPEIIGEHPLVDDFVKAALDAGAGDQFRISVL